MPSPGTLPSQHLLSILTALQISPVMGFYRGFIKYAQLIKSLATVIELNLQPPLPSLKGVIGGTESSKL